MKEVARNAAERGIPADTLPQHRLDHEIWSEEVRELYRDVVDQNAQASFYRTAFETSERYPFVQGFTVWDWNGKLKINEQNVMYDGGYGIHLKEAVAVTKEYYTKKGYTPIDDLSEPVPEEKFSEKAKEVMDMRFGCDKLISLATVNGGRPAVRTVNAYYEAGAYGNAPYRDAYRLYLILRTCQRSYLRS